MWNKAIEAANSDNLVVIGVVQEQHAERTRLYKQWKQYDFPIVQDPITENGIAVVPVFVGIDEHGIVQSTRMRPNGLSEFLETKTEAPAEAAPKLDASINYGVLAKQGSSAEDWMKWGDQELLFRGNGENSLNNAITAYRLVSKIEEFDQGVLQFRLGVAHRARYDEVSNDENDFDLASKYWSLALASNPNQYIWRRRIEQYGPRLSKPYPFYDWVDQAVEEIKARGEEPIQLKVPLTQSELAGKSKPTYSSDQTRPDPKDQIIRDEGEFIQIQSTNVPAFVSPGKTSTVHLRLVPKSGKWNNESMPLTVWIESENAKLTAQLLEFPNPDTADSTENRQLEFDMFVKKGSAECTVKGFALYNVCVEDGICVYRRQDFEFEVPFESDSD